MQAIFKLTNIVLVLSLLISSVSHIILLASDSLQYRTFVLVQITVQLLACAAVWGIQNFKLSAIIAFFLLSLVFLAINSFYINYGDFAVHFVVFVIFWLCYGSLIYKFKTSFVAKYA